MNLRFSVMGLLLILVQLSAVRCGPLSPSISKYTGIGNDSNSVRVENIPQDLGLVEVEWVNKSTDDGSFSYPINKDENSDLLEDLKKNGVIYLPVGSQEIKKIEICCIKDKRKKPNYVLHVKNVTDSLTESKLELLMDDEITPAHHTSELQEIKIHVKELND